MLQGGGALGACQAGVYEAPAEAAIYPDWVVGISIGAINGATLAGKGDQRPQKCFPNLASFRQVDAESEIAFSKKDETSPLRPAVPPRPLWSRDQVLSAFS